MNINQLTNQCNTGIRWNTSVYIICKSINTLITFFIYQNLTPHDFATWAIINSAIYIMLLWTDFGLRKSIPRYSPIFAQDYAANIRFIKIITIFYSILLCILSLLCTIGVRNTVQIYIQNNQIIPYFYCIPLIFIFEGINTLFRLLFHAYFFIKEFNVLETIYTIINLILDAIIIYKVTISSDILNYIFINKAIVNCAFAISNVYLFNKNRQKNKIITTHIIPFEKTFREFIQHSSMMWLNTILKSISERNALVPLIALFGGIENASIFKIANDGALLFQRIVLKSIGTTDTSILAYIEAHNEGEKLLQVAFTNLAQKVAALCLPLIGICFYIGISTLYIEIVNESFQIFIILTFCYLGEIILMPYERVLEVKHAYKMLLIAHIPYVIFLLTIMIYISNTWIGLVKFVCWIYFVRLVNILIMVILARRVYRVQYPTKYVLNFLGFICTTSIGLYVITNVVNINPYVSFIYLMKTFK